jgi:hypothetical protein
MEAIVADSIDLSALADLLADVEPGSNKASELEAENVAAPAEPPVDFEVVPEPAEPAVDGPRQRKVRIRFEGEQPTPEPDEPDAEQTLAAAPPPEDRVEPGDAEAFDTKEFVKYVSAGKRKGASGVLTQTWGQGVSANRADHWFHNGVQITNPGVTLVNCRVRAEITGHPATFVSCTLSPGLLDTPGHTFINCTTKEL